MSSQIDLLVEKYLTAYKVKGHTEEVFVNPTKSEVREVMRNAQLSVGVIMDRRDKKIYFFSRDNLIHQQVWRKIAPDDRKLYVSSDLLTSEWEQGGNKWHYGSQNIFTSTETLREIIFADWSFFKKWIPTIEKDVKEI